MDTVTQLTRDDREPHALAWGRLIRRKRLSGSFTPDAPKLPEGGSRQVDFAAYLGVPQATLSSWETGNSCPSMHHQTRLVKLLAIPPDELWRLHHEGAA